MTYPDGHVLSKKTDVDNAVTEIMGIDSTQFTQIAMIAQGDFLKLLLATTKERQEIFRKIFKTYNYEIFQDRLKAKSKAIENERNNARNSVQHCIGRISCDAGSDLNAELERARNGQAVNEEAFEILERIIDEDSKSSETVEKELKSTEDKLEEIT